MFRTSSCVEIATPCERYEQFVSTQHVEFNIADDLWYTNPE